MRELTQGEVEEVSGGTLAGDVAMGLAGGWSSGIVGLGTGAVIGGPLGGVVGFGVGFVLGGAMLLGYALCKPD